MRQSFATIILIGISISIHAQAFKTISGEIVDKETRNPIPFSTVFLSGQSIGTIANEEGKFRLNVPSEFLYDTLIVSHVGFHNFYGLVAELVIEIQIELTEAIVDLEEVSVEAKRLSADELFSRVIDKIKSQEGYPTNDFRMDGFYREVHSSESERTGVLECAIEIFDDGVVNNFNDILISQFRKVYDRQKNTDQFIQTKEGHNHLLLLLNSGINLVPIGKQFKSSVWKLPLELDEITYYNDRLVYILVSKGERRELRLLIDSEDYSIYKSELIMQVDELDQENYMWGKVNTKGEKCGAMIDHQSYEYRKINGKLYPYYFFRKFDFRCFDLKEENISDKSFFSTELLINNLEEGVLANAANRLKKKQGLINRKEPYDSAFWKYFNDIQDIAVGDNLTEETVQYLRKGNKSITKTDEWSDRTLKVGNHSTQEFTRADTLFGTLSPLLSCYDVTHYDLTVEISPEKEWIQGESKITFIPIEETNKIRVDLLEYLKITKIQMDGVVLKYERDLDAVYIDFPNRLMKGQKYSMHIAYEGHPLDPDFELWASGFLWDEDQNGRPFLQSLCQGYGAKAWFPVKNHLSDEADSADIHLTVPEGLTAVSNGVLTSVNTADEKSTFHWRVSNPINTYNIAAHIGDYMKHESQLHDLSTSYYFLKADSAMAKENLKIVPKMLEVFENYFGPYPFPEDGFKIVQSPYPMEHQSCVAVGKYFEDDLVLHETAHEWWGNSVSVTDNADIWIHEAFATYAESLYIEETLGYKLGQEYLNARKSDIQNDYPLVGVSDVNHFHYRIEDKYFKGALMLNTLRHLVDNDSIWFASLKGIQKNYRHSFINTQVLMAYLNNKLGKDYSAFFEQYLFTVNIPILLVDESSSLTKYRWKNVVDGFKLDIQLGDQDYITPSRQWQSTSMLLMNLKDELQTKYLIKVAKK